MKIIAEYIWIDGYQKLRSKTKVFNLKLNTESCVNININNFPLWNYDGSSTNQASGDDSEVGLIPVSFYKDCFRNNEHCYFVLCETYFKNSPHETNTRHIANTIFKNGESTDFKDPMFGLELEFFLYKDNKPLGMPHFPNNLPQPQGMYYCGIGSGNAIGRHIIEKVLRRAYISDISITGLNAEVAPGQWEFQVCDIGIRACDHFIMFKYILERTAEEFNVSINYEPKPIEGDWNGSGCHVNFSTQNMREPNGYKIITESIEKLSKKHNEHMEIYGANNSDRLTGHHETASYKEFSYGVANRGCSIRIPNSTKNNECGYFEDRRPGANIDPYLVCSKIYETSCL